jgi:DNA replicative helicase MCM subunit Mcm2 (Cdc46/Mcm family)
MIININPNQLTLTLGNLGANLVSPRGLLSRYLNSLVEVEGIVTKGSSVRPKLVKSVMFNTVTKEYKEMEHRDETSADIGMEDRGRMKLPTGMFVRVRVSSGLGLRDGTS